MQISADPAQSFGQAAGTLQMQLEPPALARGVLRGTFAAADYSVRKPMLLYAVIFISGAAILALELLASRIMTPYFGVSLYIWTGILSITLVALALGYRLGGKLASRAVSAAPAARLLQLYALMPAIAAIAIVIACLVYPRAFVSFAATNLVLGAFSAGVVLLFVPLIATSAMNPLLVAILLHRKGGGSGADAGAGKVFFVSTIGSVAGVIVTAFLLIPYISNFSAVLIIALVLALLALALVALEREPLAGKRLVGATAIAACVFAAGLLWKADTYTGRQGPFAYSGGEWRLEASYQSLFGTVKVLRTTTPVSDPHFQRMYFQDGLTQNTADASGRSTAFYTYGLESLARAYRPDMRSALVLGLGAGIVPMALAKTGVQVDVVDIDPVAAVVARTYFGFDPARARTHEADARTFLRHCDKRYDVIVVDLFHGDGTPDYLITREFFRDLRTCLARGGVAVFNTFADLARPRPYAHLLVTLRAELPQLALHRPRGRGLLINSFIVASAEPLRTPGRVTLAVLPTIYTDTLWDMLTAPVPLRPELFEDGQIISDAINPAAHDFAAMQMTYRRTVVQGAPPGLLVN
jgi:spermidine synthase